MTVDVDTLLRLVPLGLAILGGIIWNVKQGARIDSLEKADARHTAEKMTLWAKIDGLQASMQTSMNSLIAGLAKIEGKLESKE